MSSNSVQKQYILDLIVSPGFYHPHMHISTAEAIVEQHQCNITVALYYIIARYYSRVESLLASLSVWLIFLFFFQPSSFWGKIYTMMISISLFFAKHYEELLYCNVESNTSNPISNFISWSNISFRKPLYWGQTLSQRE